MINEVNATNTIYQTVRSTAKITGLSEYYLRKLLKNSKLPGFRVGNRYMVNLPSLMKQLASEEGNGNE